MFHEFMKEVEKVLDLSHDIRFVLTYCNFRMFVDLRNIWIVYIYSTIKLIVVIFDIPDCYLDCDMKYEYSRWELFCLMTLDFF